MELPIHSLQLELLFIFQAFIKINCDKFECSFDWKCIWEKHKNTDYSCYFGKTRIRKAMLAESNF